MKDTKKFILLTQLVSPLLSWELIMELTYKPITNISDIKKFINYTHNILKIDWHPDDGFMNIATNGTSEYLDYDLRATLEDRLDEIYKIIDNENNSFSYNKLCKLLIDSIDEMYKVTSTANVN
tara:strand:+ start:698 stop:1066 length:369 start_codon:yes stop_codon:yes gene_type:complete